MNWLVRVVMASGLAFSTAGDATFASDEMWLEPGPSIPPVELLDQDATPRRFADLFGDRPVLVSFFFTGCQTVCPTQTAQLVLIQQEIRRRVPSVEPAPLLVSVSLDPLGDTPQSIRTYADKFDIDLGDDAGWLMLTGLPDQLRQVWQAFDQSDGDPEDHSSLFWIGRPSKQRWTRTDVTTEPGVVFDLLTEAR